jgi:ArsR family transcriptional regulator, arsenate/arsenite/antimonite-responsive transcriptional repressor
MESALAFAKGLSDRTRLRLVAALRGRELCVCELCDALELSQSTLSTHLMVLRDSGVVQTRKNGKWIYYALRSDLGRVIDVFFRQFAAVATDRRIRRDATRVGRRLRIREDGCCTQGFDHGHCK